MYCKECGKLMTKSYGGLCQACYRYFHSGGIVHPLPEPGRIEMDEKGKPICHICGRSFTRLGSHIKESHGMSIDEYKEMFGLCRKARTTESCYSKHMRELAYQYDMPKRLIETGKSTRVIKGDGSRRKGKQVRLQEVINKRSRKSKCTVEKK